MKRICFQCAVCEKRYEVPVIDEENFSLSFLCTDCSTPLTVQMLRLEDVPEPAPSPSE